MSKRVYIGNLGYDVSGTELEKMFEPHGRVVSCQIIADRDTGQSKGYGFVEMGTDQEAQVAIKALSGLQHNGRTLTVNEARPRPSGRDTRGGAY